MTDLNANHPIASLLASAAHAGKPLTVADLERLDLADKALPPGQTLSSYKAKLASVSKQIAAEAAAGNHRAARDLADDTAYELGARMTPEQRAITSADYDDPNAIDINAMVTDIFEGN